MRVLILEDDVIHYNWMTDVLKYLGCTYTFCDSYDAVLSELDKGGEWDVYMLDHRIRGLKTGADVAHLLVSRGVPVDRIKSMSSLFTVEEREMYPAGVQHHDKRGLSVVLMAMTADLPT